MKEYRVSVTLAFTFHAAHVLPWHLGKCSRLHGHSYRVEVQVEGPLNDNGIVVDFDQLESVLQTAVFEPLDHTLLNDTLPNPTAELIGIHLMDEAERHGVVLKSVQVWETPNASALVTR
jgi:6-pyruvoyltetrahydropterin/6-carboxytetrahydropterin synthase